MLFLLFFKKVILFFWALQKWFLHRYTTNIYTVIGKSKKKFSKSYGRPCSYQQFMKISSKTLENSYLQLLFRI